jgi:plasmid stabilization system protein ParE
MPQLIWSPAALRDIQRLYRFITPKNPSAATRAVRAIREGMQIVAEHPEAGKPMENMAPEYREWLIGFGGSGYVAVYRLEGDLAVVLAVRHQREAGYF